MNSYTKNSFIPKVIILSIALLALRSGVFWGAEQADFTVVYADRHAEFVQLKAEGDGFKVEKRGIVKEGDKLPALYCTVCVPPGSTVILKDKQGKEHEVFGPDVLDLWSLQRRHYVAEQVKVTEGTVAVQNSVTVDGVRKPVGAPVLVSKGNLIKTDPCFKMTFLDISDELGEDAAAQQEALLDPTEDPIDDKQEPDPDPSS